MFSISLYFFFSSFFFFFFNDTATTEIYTLSLHDALPICRHGFDRGSGARSGGGRHRPADRRPGRSEEHTSELQSRRDLVCRLLLEKKKKKKTKKILVKNTHRRENSINMNYTDCNLY